MGVDGVTIEEFVDGCKKYSRKGSEPDWGKHNALMQKFVIDNKGALDSLPVEDDHLWFDGFMLFVTHNRRTPTPSELTYDMMDEWDDPVSDDDAERFLRALQLTAQRTVD